MTPTVTMTAEDLGHEPSARGEGQRRVLPHPDRDEGSVGVSGSAGHEPSGHPRCSRNRLRHAHRSVRRARRLHL